jgi:hypothetical protein
MKVYILTTEYIGGFVYEEDTQDVTGDIEDAEAWTKEKADEWIKAYMKDYSWVENANKLKRVDEKEEKGWETKYRRFVYRTKELRKPIPNLTDSAQKTEVQNK